MDTRTPKSANAADETRDGAALHDLGIPACPAILETLRRQLACDDPDFKLIGRTVASDVSLTAVLLHTVNSAAFGLSRKVGSVDQALSMIGARQLFALVTRLVVRQALNAEGPRYTRFWDVSAKRSHALLRMARTLRCVDTGVAQTFGLFCDVGIVLLMQRVSGYDATLKACDEEVVCPFTDIEQDAHRTDHAIVGSIMARAWGVAPEICEAIRAHHDYAIFTESGTPEIIARLIAMTLLADLAIQRYGGLYVSHEWTKGGQWVAGALVLSQDDVEDWVETLGGDFAAGVA